jgi:hypothetical protein
MWRSPVDTYILRTAADTKHINGSTKKRFVGLRLKAIDFIYSIFTWKYQHTIY